MRANWITASGSFAALILSFSVATAQDRTGGTVGAQVQPTAAFTGNEATAQGEIGVQARAAVSPEEQLEQASQISRRAGQLAERLSKMLDEARRDKDILRANCINRKLTEANANTRNVEQRTRALKDATTAGDDARRSHEFTVLTVLSQKLDQIDQEATQCLGQSVYEPGESQVVTTIPGITTSFVDPSSIPPDPPAPPAVVVPPGMSDASPVTPVM